MPVSPTEALMPFVRFVFPGWALAFLGALLLLGAAAYWSVKSDGVRLHVKPAWWRAAVALGVGLFILGAVWQLVGYVQIGAVTWPR
ncbi:MAG: hypothetical protein HY725_14630 [Candidatus Rokubacteria bacterium]|nr:hypothetical protein [Candidatus Rokubacteria bacterium]